MIKSECFAYSLAKLSYTFCKNRVFQKNAMVKHRVTRPLRTPTAKSYMPYDQVHNTALIFNPSINS